MYQLKSYIRFLLNSTNQHGVHSPFIYYFITKCLYDKASYSAYNKLKAYRNTLISSNDSLDITDLGEGSKVLGSKTRKVNKMVKVSSSSMKEARLLFKVVQYFNCKSILELGTSLGMGTYAMALANEFSNVTSIEGCANTSDYTKHNFKKLKINHITFLKGDFATTISTLKQSSFDCIYFDGHHNKDATIKYFEALLPKANNNAVFIFDDIYWSKGMTEAWQYIKAHEAVTVTVDIFQLGFVFFRKEQAREHFKIRV
ncbi:O-methyltransferase [Winogradskyella sp.]|uniref:O-methyltransferase n=1 Tax=Winogradskyella sp. TaxID=1883156 RepID=UPI00260F1BE5|nr:class I SAM-dependent methyltransferase [Winogradskyella sp.]